MCVSIFYSCLWRSNISLRGYTNHIATLLPIDGHLGCFHFYEWCGHNLWISFVWMLVFSSVGSVFRSGIAGLHAYSMFNLLRNFWPVSWSGCTISHSQQQCEDSSLPHPPQHLLLSVSFITAILAGTRVSLSTFRFRKGPLLSPSSRKRKFGLWSRLPRLEGWLSTHQTRLKLCRKWG